MHNPLVSRQGGILDVPLVVWVWLHRNRGYLVEWPVSWGRERGRSVIRVVIREGRGQRGRLVDIAGRERRRGSE